MEDQSNGDSKEDNSVPSDEPEPTSTNKGAKGVKKASTVIKAPRVIKSRPPELRFAQTEELFEASLKHMPHWIDSMFIYSVIWAFGSILTEEAKKEFEIHIRKIFHDKKKRDKELEEQRRLEEMASSQNESEVSSDPRTETSKDQEAYQLTPEFGVGSIDAMESMLPENDDVFDVFFDISTNSWKLWKHVYNFWLEEKGGFTERIQRSILTSVCWTQDLLRYNHILDKACPTNQSVLFFGRTATGKSTLLRNYLSQHDGVARAINFEMVSFTPLLKSAKLQSVVESRVEPVLKAVCQPPADKQVVFMIDDLNMSHKDKFGHSSTLELLRQWMDNGKWYNQP